MRSTDSIGCGWDEVKGRRVSNVTREREEEEEEHDREFHLGNGEILEKWAVDSGGH